MRITASLLYLLYSKTGKLYRLLQAQRGRFSVPPPKSQSYTSDKKTFNYETM